MLQKITKAETRKETAEQLRILARLYGVNREELTEEQQNKHNLKIELVKRNLTLLIDSAFRGNECKTSTTFDYSTELWQELKPYYKKNIGEARRKEIAELIADYFNPEIVNGLKIKCFIHIEEYSNYICFYIIRNGYTYGNDTNITDIFLRDIDPSHPFDPEGCRRNRSGEMVKNSTYYRYDGEYIPAAKVTETINAYYKRELKRYTKIKKLLSEVNGLIAEGRNDCKGCTNIIDKPIYINVNRFYKGV